MDEQEHIEICSQKDVNMPAFRPPRLVLDNSLIAGTGFQPMPLDQELDALVQEFKLPPPFSDN